jgi:transcriptional regulator with XRE-family HTH domain
MYLTYVFRKEEQDPIIDELRTLMKDTGLTVKEISEKSGLNHNTISRWINGDTRRPQYASVVAAVRAMGFDISIVQRDKRNVVHLHRGLRKPPLKHVRRS